MQSLKTNESGQGIALSLQQGRELSGRLVETVAQVDRCIREEEPLVREAIYTALISIMCDEMSEQSARGKSWH